jgi:YfiH family protein
MSMMHEDPICSIFFGDARHAFVPYQYKGFSALQKPPFNSLARSMGLKQLVFLRQTHGVYGKVVYAHDVHDALPSFVHDGDFLITATPQIGLGIATADCLPIIIVDSMHKVVGIAHAGWRGAVAGVGSNLLVRMNELFKTMPEHVTVYFGPSALPCCYEVQEDFQEHLRLSPHASQSLIKRDNKYYFDQGFFNRKQLELVGVPSEAINQTFHQCTICNPRFCSARRLKSEERQMTVVVVR